MDYEWKRGRGRRSKGRRSGRRERPRDGAEEDGVWCFGKKRSAQVIRSGDLTVVSSHYPAQKGTIRSLLLIPPPAPSKVERQERLTSGMSHARDDFDGLSRRYATETRLSSVVPGDESPGYVREPLRGSLMTGLREEEDGVSGVGASVFRGFVRVGGFPKMQHPPTLNLLS
jgi:hypothetical protein